jgi:hypothetical protein
MELIQMKAVIDNKGIHQQWLELSSCHFSGQFYRPGYLNKDPIVWLDGAIQAKQIKRREKYANQVVSEIMVWRTLIGFLCKYFATKC